MGFMIASVFMILGVVLIEEAQGCPDPIALSEQVERCMEPLSEPTHKTVMGLLQSTTWRPACKIYNASVECVSELKRQCRSQSHETEVTSSTLSVLKNGFGKICEKEAIRNRYMKYAPCYEAQAGKSQECLEDFTKRVHEISASDMEMESYDEYPMCGAFQEMVRCVNKAVEECGSDAASILDSLMRAQVPQQITQMCQDSVPEPTPHSNNDLPNNTGSASVRVPIIVLVFASTFFCL